MWPSPLRSRAGRRAFVTRITPSTLVSYICRQFSSSAAATGSSPSAPPALLTTTDTSGTLSASSATESGSATSSRTARPPTSRASSSQRSRRRAAATTSKPLDARDRTVAAPIPLLAPVTRAVLAFALIDRTLSGHDSLGCGLDRLGCARLGGGGQCHAPDLIGPHREPAGDRVHRHSGGTAAPGDLARQLSLEALGVEAPLSRDHGVRVLQEAVESEDAQHEGCTRDQVGAECSPEAAGETTRRARHRPAPGIARKGSGKGH